MNDYKYYEKEEPKTMEYTPDGKYLIVGTSSGLIRIFDPFTMQEVQGPCKVSEDKSPTITNLVVANDSQHFATMDDFLSCPPPLLSLCCIEVMQDLPYSG